MTRQRKPEETYCNFANFKSEVDSKTDINQNGVLIIKKEVKDDGSVELNAAKGMLKHDDVTASNSGKRQR